MAGKVNSTNVYRYILWHFCASLCKCLYMYFDLSILDTGENVLILLYEFIPRVVRFFEERKINPTKLSL